MKRKEILALRVAAMTKVNSLISTAEAANRDLTEDELTLFNALKAEVAGYDAKLATLDEVEAMNRAGEQHTATANEPTRRPLVGDPANSGNSEQEDRDLDSFSMTSFLRGAVNRATGDGEPLVGIEREMSQEARNEAASHGVDLKGLGVPQMILQHRSRNNAMTVTGGSGNEGGDFVPTELRSMVDILRDNMVLAQMGATFIGGLSGNVEWPRVIDGTEPSEKTENGEADVRTLGTGVITSTPHRLPVVSEYSTQLLLQSSPDVESYIRQDLMTSIALRMERQAINGDGVGANVLGLLNTAGIGAVAGGANGAAPTENHLIDLEGAVELLNALDGNLGYLTNTKVKTKLKKTRIETGQTDKVWAKDNTLNGYSNVGVTNLVPSNLTKGTANGNASAIIFGNFADMLLNQWGGLDVLVNPYSKDSQGLIRVTVSTFFDMVLRRAASFAAMKDALPG